MRDKPISGLIIARFAEAHGLAGTQAERLIRNMTPDTRMAVLDFYGEVHDRGVKTSEYYADPDLIEMDRVSAELDQMRQAHRGRDVIGETPDDQLPPGNLASLYSPSEIAEVYNRSSARSTEQRKF